MWKWYIYISIYQPQPRGLQRLQLAELGLSEVCSPSDVSGRNPGWRRLAPYASARSWCCLALNTWPSCALPVTRAFLWNMLAEVSEQGKTCYVSLGQLKMDIDAYLGVRCCGTLGEGSFHETHALLCCGSFKDRKPIGELCCCDAWMAERTQRWIERWLRLWGPEALRLWVFQSLSPWVSESSLWV